MFSPVLARAKSVSGDWQQVRGLFLCDKGKFWAFEKDKEKINLPLADLHPKCQWQQQAKRIHILGPHLCHLCSAQSCQSFPVNHFHSSPPHPFQRPLHFTCYLVQISSTISPLSWPKSIGVQIDLVRAADASQTHLIMSSIWCNQDQRSFIYQEARGKKQYQIDLSVPVE